MRLMERAAARAQLPLKYTQGFNPHPRLSLAWPRPVGIASRCELLTVELQDAPPGQEASLDWPGRLARQWPGGIDLVRCEPMEGTKAPAVLSSSYEIDLEGPEVQAAQERLAQLAQEKTWVILRRSGPEGPKAPAQKPLDLKPLLGEIKLAEGRLAFTLTCEDGPSARPGEVLQLLFGASPGSTGVSPVPPENTGETPVLPQMLSRLVRTHLALRSQRAEEDQKGSSE